MENVTCECVCVCVLCSGVHACVCICMIASECTCPIDNTITHVVTSSSKVPNHENSDRIHEARAPSWLDGFCALRQFSFPQGTFCRPTRIQMYTYTCTYVQASTIVHYH